MSRRGAVRPYARAGCKLVGQRLRLGGVAAGHLDGVTGLDGTTRDGRGHTARADDADSAHVQVPYRYGLIVRGLSARPGVRAQHTGHASHIACNKQVSLLAKKK